jgi:hypothetical protein
VNNGVIGAYMLYYAYDDSTGNTGNIVMRTVTISSGNIPIITLSGSNTITQEALTNYAELGARWDDVEDGSGTNVTIS